MMENDMLKNIEYLREKADVSYEEAADLLEKHGGNVMRVLVELERQGRVYRQPYAGNDANSETHGPHARCNDAKGKAASFLDNAMKHRLVVERNREDGGKETVANISAPLAAGVAIFVPWLTVAATAVAFATGHTAKIEKTQKGGKDEKDA